MELETGVQRVVPEKASDSARDASRAEVAIEASWPKTEEKREWHEPWDVHE